ncbi:MAG: aspartate carbamoyltransferase regulatory subunit [Bacteroidales bacterium]|nr:aspartate carbamoyltransferase regulatory subunit [Bacteroidales bacterium]
MKEFVVKAIDNGTVIDHIPSENVFNVIKILNLDTFDNQILFGTNLESKKLGLKGIIKMKNKYFEKDEINKIALFAPKATLIKIKDYQIIEKTTVTPPEKIEAIVKCFNPNCITNTENITTKFTVIDKVQVKLLCHYCEKITDKENFIISK